MMDLPRITALSEDNYERDRDTQKKERGIQQSKLPNNIVCFPEHARKCMTNSYVTSSTMRLDYPSRHLSSNVHTPERGLMVHPVNTKPCQFNPDPNPNIVLCIQIHTWTWPCRPKCHKTPPQRAGPTTFELPQCSVALLLRRSPRLHLLLLLCVHRLQPD